MRGGAFVCLVREGEGAENRKKNRRDENWKGIKKNLEKGRCGEAGVRKRARKAGERKSERQKEEGTEGKE